MLLCRDVGLRCVPEMGWYGDKRCRLLFGPFKGSLRWLVDTSHLQGLRVDTGSPEAGGLGGAQESQGLELKGFACS